MLLVGLNAEAGDYRVLAGLGFGGTGIVEDQTVSGSSSSTVSSISKSEGPGMFTLGIEKIMTDHLTLAFDHSRGFRLGPFSSGVSFTGFTGRYYLSPVPWGNRDSKEGPTLFVKRFHSYVGLQTGLATGTIDRQYDLVPSVTASGIYVGFNVGFDLPWNTRGLGLRPEISYSTTIASSTPNPTALELFFVGCQVYFQW